jgi:crotonobetaine/carnitine-CoA ligase
MTVPFVLRRAAKTWGDRRFLNCVADGRHFSFSDMDTISNRLANGLHKHGFTKGQHVAVMVDNSPEQLFVYFALAKIGAVTVKINAAARGEMLKYFLSQSDSTALIIDEAFLPRFIEVAGAVPAIRSFIVNGETIAQDAAAQQRNVVSNTTRLASLFSNDETSPPVEVRHSDLAYISYTSGTTGPSKGVLFSQARTVSGGVKNVEAFGHRSTDVIYVCLPMYHTNAMQGSVYPALLSGARLILAPRFSVSSFWSDCREHGVTIVNMLGSMVNFLWNRPPTPEDSQHKVRLALCAPVPPFALQFEERFGMRFVGGYGLTDYHSPLVFTLNDPPEKLGAMGRPCAGFEVAIVDDDDFPVGIGESGEIVMRCNIPWYASSGYYRMPEQTLESLRNGWFHTGDRGRIDEDGYYWFVDRKKDAIRRRGENISAYEVEQILGTHPAVAEAAVFAVRSEHAEDEVACSIVLRDGASLSETELIAYCTENMPRFMVPRFVRFCADLPRNLSQKIEKYKLQQEAATKRDLYWDREAAGIVINR